MRKVDTKYYIQGKDTEEVRGKVYVAADNHGWTIKNCSALAQTTKTHGNGAVKSEAVRMW
ncbi:MAG: hypothetical protein LBH47_00270 [Christensenellaceae bacterium]|jgi:hypothetical protein|nr:hypothetical protein [Christensenellaceae bacterium]